MLSVGVILLFFIGEGFDPSKILLSVWPALLLFPLAVVVGMFVAWRREGLGGGLTVAGLAAFYLYSLLLFGKMPRGPFFLLLSALGFLFLLYHLIRHAAHAHKAAALRP
jgi:CHASE2 domain-containing sensor protein